MTVIFEDAEAPRGQAGRREPTALGRFVEELRQLRADIEALERGSQLRNASISGGQGLRILDEDGTPQAQISPDRTVTIFDQAGAPVVRMGDMQETGPLDYGIEVRIGADWIQLGSQNVTWGNVGSKPAWAANTASIAGGYISGPVGSATEADHALQADGSSRAFNNTVGGTQFYAVWVGNDGNFNMGRNTSSRRYKTNIREHQTNYGVLAIEETVFDRKAQLSPPPDGQAGPEQLVAGSRDEYGAIAEQVAQVFPEAVQYFDGQIDGIRYEMIGLGLVPVVRDQEERIALLEDARKQDRALILELKQALTRLTGSGAGTTPPAAPTTKGPAA